jgi:hypothetical protein
MVGFHITYFEEWGFLSPKEKKLAWLRVLFISVSVYDQYYEIHFLLPHHPANDGHTIEESITQLVIHGSRYVP